MEFTKNEIETSKKMFKDWFGEVEGVGNYLEYLDSLLKPERKKIRVEIEWDETGMDDITGNSISTLITRNHAKERNLKVTELPEVFTIEDIEDLKEYLYRKTAYDKGFLHNVINDWFSERKSK